MESVSTTSTLWKRLLAGAAVVLYLAYLTAGLYWHVVGDTGASPLAQYFVTWDMFPSYRSTGRRIVAIGETESGRFVRVYPSPRHQRRFGLYGELTRLDGLLQPFAGGGGAVLESELAATLREFDDPDDPVRLVHVVREEWPAKFNLPEFAYRRIALDGDPPTDTRTWRVQVSREARTLRDVRDGTP